MKLTARMTKLESRLSEWTKATTFFAEESAQAAAKFHRRIEAMRERFFADPMQYPPWEHRSAAEKLATAETSEQVAEAGRLMEEGLARGKERQWLCEEQIRQHRATHRKRPRQHFI
jgi:hypothetical protein